MTNDQFPHHKCIFFCLIISFFVLFSVHLLFKYWYVIIDLLQDEDCNIRTHIAASIFPFIKNVLGRNDIHAISSCSRRCFDLSACELCQSCLFLEEESISKLYSFVASHFFKDGKGPYFHSSMCACSKFQIIILP